MTEHDPQAPPKAPPLNPLQAALAGVTDLSKRVGELTAEVVRLRTYGRRSRTFILVDIVLTLALAAVSYLAASASSSAHQNNVTLTQLHQAQVASCQGGNQTRTQEIALWTHLAKIASPSPHLTKAQIAANKREVAELLAYIRMTFRPRDCKSIYRIDGGTS